MPLSGPTCAFPLNHAHLIPPLPHHHHALLHRLKAYLHSFDPTLSLSLQTTSLSHNTMMPTDSQLEMGYNNVTPITLTLQSSHSTSSVDTLADEKQRRFSVEPVSHPKNELSPSELALIKPPSKKTVSTWIRFQIWFTLYRCVFTPSKNFLTRS